MPVDGRLPAVDETLTMAALVASRRCGKPARIVAHVAHDVQLPVRVPLVVSDFLEPRMARDAGVVHEHVEPAEGGDCLRDGPLGLSRDRQVAVTWSASPMPGAAPRPHVATRAPSSTSCAATARPMPRVEPVTRHARPASPRSMAS